VGLGLIAGTLGARRTEPVSWPGTTSAPEPAGAPA